jgi:hypothetical protein
MYCLFLLAPAAQAADLPNAWVELAADGGLDVRAVTMPGAPCPKVLADGSPLASRQRGSPDPTDGAYPIQVCVAHAAVTARGITVDGLPYPVLPRSIKRIVVIGDTGCRLKGDNVQDCNDPAQWPFAAIARLAAARHPDLVVHVGDYHYRESPCPAARAGCAGSPYGDNWAVWRKTSSILRRRCSRRRRGYWCAAITSCAAAVAMAGSGCSIRTRIRLTALPPPRPTRCTSIRCSC